MSYSGGGSSGGGSGYSSYTPRGFINEYTGDYIHHDSTYDGLFHYDTGGYSTPDPWYGGWHDSDGYTRRDYAYGGIYNDRYGYSAPDDYSSW